MWRFYISEFLSPLSSHCLFYFKKIHMQMWAN